MTDREKLRGHALSADHEVVLLRGLEDLLSGTLVACENLQQILGSYLIPLIIDHHSFIHVRRVAGIVVELASLYIIVMMWSGSRPPVLRIWYACAMSAW